MAPLRRSYAWHCAGAAHEKPLHQRSNDVFEDLDLKIGDQTPGLIRPATPGCSNTCYDLCHYSYTTCAK